MAPSSVILKNEVNHENIGKENYKIKGHKISLSLPKFKMNNIVFMNF